MEINGLPLHPLVVHGAVVLGPIAALVALVYAAVPPWRDRLRWPMLALAVVATGAVVAAYFSGKDFLEGRPELRQLPAVTAHAERAELLLWLALGFGAAALVAGALHDRPGALRVVLSVVLAATAVAALVQVVLTGEAGARAVWGSGQG